MPNLNVTANAVKLAQTTTNTPTLISNIGSENVFLGADPSVNANVFDHFLSPGKQINWPADKELWAVTDTGTTSTITVMYNATGASATEVGIVGPVDVDVVNPVNVQGGGTILYSDDVTVPAGSSVDVLIDGPANGLTYYGVDVYWELLTSGSGITAGRINVYNDSDIAPSAGAIPIRDTSAEQIGSLGWEAYVSFTVPMKKEFPLRVRVFNSHPSSSLTGFLRVTGTSYSFPFPQDATPFVDVFTTFDESISMSNAVTGQYVTIAPSFNDQVFNFDTLNSATGGVIEVQSVNAGTGISWYTTETFPNHALFGGTVITQNPIEPFTKSRFVVPGTGKTHRLIVTSDITGIVRVSYRGRGMS